MTKSYMTIQFKIY